MIHLRLVDVDDYEFQPEISEYLRKCSSEEFIEFSTKFHNFYHSIDLRKIVDRNLDHMQEIKLNDKPVIMSFHNKKKRLFVTYGSDFEGSKHLI